MKEFGLIILTTTLYAIIYGVVHDQFTIRMSLEYFTVAHPPVFATRNPTLLAASWGVFSTWWIGILAGILLAFASRFGGFPKLHHGHALSYAPCILMIALLSATIYGVAGYAAAILGLCQIDPYMARHIPIDSRTWFITASFIHAGSYAGGIIATVGVSACLLRTRTRL